MSEAIQTAKFEYEFVRLDSCLTGGPSAAALDGYQAIVHERAGQGWRLVQIFAPTTLFGTAYWELIFERQATAEQ
jgi:hypothetical protein